MHTSLFRYHRHRLPAKIISHSAWLYFRFALSFRDVEETFAMRGDTVSYETVREWCLKSASLTPMVCAADLLDPATDGSSTKCSYEWEDICMGLAVTNK